MLIVIVLYTEFATMQYTMVTAALPKMATAFPSVGANISWAVIILGIVGASVTPLLTKASDIWGKKLVFLVCGLLFVIGCLICALTSDWTLFLIGRGISATGVASQFIAYGLVRDLMPRRYVPIGIGMIGAGVGFSGALAPIIGGLLIEHFSWRSMFWFLIAYTVVLTPLVMWLVPETRLKVRERIDVAGAGLLCGGALLTLLYLDNGQSWGWGKPSALVWLIVGLLLLVAFFVVESRISRPFMDMKLLASPKVSLVLVMAFFGIAITAVLQVALSYLTQTPSAGQLTRELASGAAATVHLPASAVRVALDPDYSYGSGFSMLQFALHIALWIGVMSVIFGPIAGLLARRVGTRIPAIIGFTLLTLVGVGFALLHYSWHTYLLLTIVVGISFGFVNFALPNLIVEAVPAEQQGISAGILGVTMSLSSSVAVAITTAILNNNPVRAQLDIGGHRSVTVVPQVFASHGYQQSFWVMLGATVIALIIAVLIRFGRTPATGGAHG